MKSKLIGNILITLSLFLIGFIYFPFFSLYFIQPKKIDELAKGFFIEIPKIYAQAPIIKDVDPFLKAEYTQALKKGVAQAKNNPQFFFAHSSLPFWEVTRTNTPFLRLYELGFGDEIKIIENGKVKKYLVFNKREVWPSEVSAINIVDKDTIILQTCIPLGTDLKRLLVWAKLKNN